MGGLTDSGREVGRRIFTPAAVLLNRLGVSPDVVTVVGTLGVAASALVFFPRGHFFVGTLVVCVFIFSDAVDGTMARLSGRTSPWGAFLDSSLDRIADSAIFVAVALWYSGLGASQLLVAVSLTALVGGLMVSYTRARAASLGANASVGVAERTERLVLLLASAGLSGLLDAGWILAVGVWVVAVLSWVTVCQRMWSVRGQLAEHR